MGFEERRGGWMLVSCSRALIDKERKTRAFIPVCRKEFVDTVFKLLLGLKLHICLCGSLGQYAIHMLP